MINLDAFNSGGAASHWEIVEGGLPPGARLHSDGVIEYDFAGDTGWELDELAEDLASVIVRVLKYLARK